MTDTTKPADDLTDPAVGEPYTDEEIAAMRAIIAVVDGAEPTGPTPWSLGGDAPEPQRAPELKPADDAQSARLSPSDTHTGTDPSGRAIGPAEDHTKMKKIRNEKGEIVTPKRPTARRP